MVRSKEIIGFPPPVPLEAVQSYETNAEKLLDVVNHELLSMKDLYIQHGNNMRDLMADNHKNHILFMASVMKSNNWEIMASTTPWVYRTYQARGFYPEYFLQVNRAFQKAVHRYLEPALADSVVQVYQWMQSLHEEMVVRAREEPSMPSVIDPAWEDSCSRFTAAILAGDPREPMQLARERVNDRDHLGGFYLNVIQPAMEEVGKMWEIGEISVAQEHLASAIVTRVMASLYSRFIMLEQTRGKVLVTAAPNEFHEIGPRMVADLLEVHGWDVDYFGANVPAEDFFGVVKTVKPFIAAISVSMAFNLDKAARMIHLIRSDPELESVRIMLGGRCLVDHPQLGEKMGADDWCSNAEAAVSLAEKWWEHA